MGGMQAGLFRAQPEGSGRRGQSVWGSFDKCDFYFRRNIPGTSLVSQRLRFHTLTAGGTGSIPGQELRPNQHAKKGKKKKKLKERIAAWGWRRSCRSRLMRKEAFYRLRCPVLGRMGLVS